MVGGPVETLREAKPLVLEAAGEAQNFATFHGMYMKNASSASEFCGCFAPVYFESLTHFKKRFSIYIEFARSLPFFCQIFPNFCSWICEK